MPISPPPKAAPLKPTLTDLPPGAPSSDSQENTGLAKPNFLKILTKLNFFALPVRPLKKSLIWVRLIPIFSFRMSGPRCPNISRYRLKTQLWRVSRKVISPCLTCRHCRNIRIGFASLGPGCIRRQAKSRGLRFMLLPGGQVFYLPEYLGGSLNQRQDSPGPWIFCAGRNGTLCHNRRRHPIFVNFLHRRYHADASGERRPRLWLHAPAGICRRYRGRARAVKAGELIGGICVGRYGTLNSPPHLHIQVYPDHQLSHETLVDPYDFLGSYSVASGSVI